MSGAEIEKISLVDLTSPKKNRFIYLVSSAFFICSTIGLAIWLSIVYSNSDCSLDQDSVSRPIVVASLRQTFHQVEAVAVDYVLRERGYETEFIVIEDYVTLFDSLFDGTSDMIPSVWLPDGHITYLEDSGRVVNEDYVIISGTSEAGLFFWMASPAAYDSGVISIDDLTNPANTVDFDMKIYMSAPADAGLTIGSVDIIERLNTERTKMDPASPNFTYSLEWNSQVEEDLFNKLDTSGNSTDKFIVAWYAPWWGYEEYITNGLYQELNNGYIGEQYFGRTNRGSTITTPQFLSSGAIDDTTLNVLSSIFVGNDAINYMDTYLHNNASATIYDAFERMRMDSRYKYWYDNYAVVQSSFGGKYTCENDL